MRGYDADERHTLVLDLSFVYTKAQSWICALYIQIHLVNCRVNFWRLVGKSFSLRFPHCISDITWRKNSAE